MDAAVGSRGKDMVSVMAEVAGHYYEVAGLYEDEDLDPDDHASVVRRAFANSDCDDFAAVLHEITGWPIVQASLTSRNDDVGHHAMVRSPEGRLLDVTGWTDETEVRKRYRAKTVSIREVASYDVDDGQLDDAGALLVKGMITDVVRVLPIKPFDETWFRQMSTREMPGIDTPYVGVQPR